ncbi:MAG TPA: sigma-70 family RNA polymerase sigma factor [Candidatus Acidoferrum sp.]|nr:sigma-70 family RNA polymerase sigma factor [Candidatus Acidoferrum sp.]
MACQCVVVPMEENLVVENLVLRDECEGLDERSLVAAARYGESVAFDVLCERLAPRILRSLLRITKNREDAEDALQNAFLSAFIHIAEFDGRSAFSTWLTRIAINSALMVLRKKRTSREISLDGSADSDTMPASWEMPDHAPTPEKRYAQHERENILRGAISTLRPAVRKVIELQQLQEHSMKETAAIIGISVPAAKARLFHGKVALRKASRLKSIRPGRIKHSHLPFVVPSTPSSGRRAMSAV